MAEPKGLGAVLGGGESEDDTAESDVDAAKMDAASAAMSAMKANDAEGFKLAMADFVKLCMGAYDE